METLGYLREVMRSLLTPTEEHFQFDQAAHEAVKVDGVLSVGVAVDDGLQNRAVNLETCGWKKTLFGFCFSALL